MNMGDVGVIGIVMKGGSEMWNSEIGKEYLEKRKEQDNVEFGGEINDSYKENKIRGDCIGRKCRGDIGIKDE